MHSLCLVWEHISPTHLSLSATLASHMLGKYSIELPHLQPSPAPLLSYKAPEISTVWMTLLPRSLIPSEIAIE